MDGFEDFYRSYYPVLVRMAARLVSRADAEDVAQTIMMRVLQNSTAVDRNRDMGPWLHTVVRRACWDVRRRDGAALAAYESMPLRETVDDVERRVLAREFCRTLGHRVRGFSAEDRNLLQQVVEGVPCAEVARRRSVDSGSIRVRLFRIRCALRGEAPPE